MSPSRHTLAIEGATYQGSVALIRDGAVLCERTLHAEDGGAPRAGRGERLMPAIAECLAEVGIEGDHAAIERIVCGAGPGSFTSLRVAGSVAKGLAVGYGVDLYAVSSLILTVAGVEQPLAGGSYLSLLPAMRGEFFSQRIDVAKGGSMRELEPARLLTAAALADLQSSDSELRVIGPGQEIDAF